MKRFLAIGECMIEMAPTGAPQEYRAGFAGDTFNTAWYMRQLVPAGASVAYLSAIGDDAPSSEMARFMAQEGIEPVLARRTGKTVGLYLITLSDGERSFSYWRESSAARTLADDLDTLPGLTAGDVVYFSGITLAILAPDARARLLSVLSAARSEGVQVAFDPNLRPRLWDSTDQMRAAIMAGAEVSDFALPSFEDEADHFGDADLTATAARYAGVGVGTVVVKNGAGPVWVTDGSTGFEVAPTPAPNAVDTTAAGDSFNAGFLAERATGAPLEAAVRAGCTVAGQVIAQRGALVPLKP